MNAIETAETTTTNEPALPVSCMEQFEDEAIEILHQWMRDFAPAEIRELWHAREVFRVGQRDPEFADVGDWLRAIGDVQRGREYVNARAPARRVQATA